MKKGGVDLGFDRLTLVDGTTAALQGQVLSLDPPGNKSNSTDQDDHRRGRRPDPRQLRREAHRHRRRRRGRRHRRRDPRREHRPEHHGRPGHDGLDEDHGSRHGALAPPGRLPKQRRLLQQRPGAYRRRTRRPITKLSSGAKTNNTRHRSGGVSLFCARVQAARTRARRATRAIAASRSRSGVSTSRLRDARLRGGPRARSARRRAVVLEIDARDEPVAEQERQHVVAVHALVLRRVDLQAEVESNSSRVRSRSQTSESNGESSARASMRRGRRAPRARYGRRAALRPHALAARPRRRAPRRARARRRHRAGSSRAGRVRSRSPSARAAMRTSSRCASASAASARRAPRAAARARADRRRARSPCGTRS